MQHDLAGRRNNVAPTLRAGVQSERFVQLQKSGVARLLLLHLFAKLFAGFPWIAAQRATGATVFVVCVGQATA